MAQVLTSNRYLESNDTKVSNIIFGGTFDPIHKGHIQDIKFLLANSNKVFIAPTEQNPWKDFKATSLSDRIEMIEIALKYESIDNSNIEVLKDPYQYSIDVVTRLKHLGYTNIFWAIGEDLKDSAPKWKNWGTEGCPLIVLPLVEGISSTQIRNGKIEPHPALKSYIESKKLYQ